jgi:tRNA1Val (adenine37-N6)-methyltransferase
VETVTRLKLGELRLIQASKGYRFSLDPLLLVNFSKVREEDQVVDLGTGSGVIPLLLARLSPARQVLGIELQPELALRAEQNVALNQLQEKVRILRGDVRRIRELLPAAGTDLVVSNPPYRKLRTGRVAPQGERAAARHELAGGLADFVRAAAWLLKNGGRLALIFLAERLPELLAQMRDCGIEPKRLRMIHSRQAEPAKMFMVEGRKMGRPGLVIEAPLIIYQGAGRAYTPEVLRIYGEPG